MNPPDTVDDHQEPRPLRAWERIHVRMSLLYGAVVLLVLVIVGGAIYDRAVGSVEDALQIRALNLAHLLAQEVAASAAAPPYVPGKQAEEPARNLGAAQRGVRHLYAVARPGDDGLPSWVFRVNARPAPDDEEDPAVPENTSALKEAFTGAGAAEGARQISGRLVISAYAPIPGHPAVVAGVDLDATSLSEARRRTRTLLLGGLGLAMALLLVITLVVGRRVRIPFEQLLEAASVRRATVTWYTGCRSSRTTAITPASLPSSTDSPS